MPDNIKDAKLEVLSDELTDIGKEFKKEIDSLRDDDLISLEESRIIFVYFASIASSIRCLIRCDNYEYAWDKIIKTYWKIKNNIKDVESSNVYVSSNYISHSNAMVKISNRLHTLIWEIDNLKHPGNWPWFSSIAFMAVDYGSDYIFNIIGQRLSKDHYERSRVMSTEELLEKAEKEFKKNILFYRDKLVKSLMEINEDERSIYLNSIDENWKDFREAINNLGVVQLFKDEEFVNEL